MASNNPDDEMEIEKPEYSVFGESHVDLALYSATQDPYSTPATDFETPDDGVHNLDLTERDISGVAPGAAIEGASTSVVQEKSSDQDAEGSHDEAYTAAKPASTPSANVHSPTPAIATTPHIVAAYDAFMTGWSNPSTPHPNHLTNAQTLAHALLTHYYPPTTGFTTTPHHFQVTAAYGLSIAMPPTPTDLATIPSSTYGVYHRIPETHIAGLCVHKTYDLGGGAAKAFPHAYTAILVDDLASFARWPDPSDREWPTHRGDLLCQSFGVTAEIRRGVGFLVLGTRVEVWRYDEGCKAAGGPALPWRAERAKMGKVGNKLKGKKKNKGKSKAKVEVEENEEGGEKEGETGGENGGEKKDAKKDEEEEELGFAVDLREKGLEGLDRLMRRAVMEQVLYKNGVVGTLGV